MADQVRRVPVQMAHEVPDGSGAVADKVAELSGAHSRQSSGGLRYKNLPRSSKLLGIPHEFILHKCFASVFVFFQQRKLNGVFSPDKLRCVPVRVAGAGSGGRFRKVLESSAVCWCRFRKQVPEGS